MSIEIDPDKAFAMLDWQLDLGVTETIGENPVNWFEVGEKTSPVRTGGQAPKPAPGDTLNPDSAKAVAANIADDFAVDEARNAANMAVDLEQLRTALSGFQHCDLKKGARNLVFSDGNPVADLMIVGEAPGREEDLQGRPFVGRAGQLLDRMLAAISHDRTSDERQSAVYIANVLPWRPPQNRDPEPEEIAMMLPFLLRHIDLVAPKIIVPMGNIACQALLGQRGITRLRGTWSQIGSLPALPMFHPAYLLRNPAAKREAWMDLLKIQHRLREHT